MPAARKGKVAREKLIHLSLLILLDFLNWIKSGLCQEGHRGK